MEKKDLRIVFVNPGLLGSFFHPSDLSGENLGIAYLAAFLREYGYLVKIVDQYTFHLSSEKVVQEIMEFKPSLVGISPNIHTMQETITIGQRVKQFSPGVHVTLGGHHVSLAAGEILEKECWCDSVVRGYGEETIRELAESLLHSSPVLEINGIWYRNRDQIIRNPDRWSPPNLEALPFPSRDVLQGWRTDRINPSCRIITSRGCFGKCSFCSTPPFERLHKPPYWQARIPQNVVDEIEELQKEFNIQFISFCDDNFLETNQGIKRAAKIAREIIERNIKIKFNVFARADTILKNVECLRLLKKAGLIRCLVGLEALIDYDLTDVFGKEITVNQNIALANLLSQEGIVLTPGFINFHPYSSFEGLRRNAIALFSLGQAMYFWNFASQLELYPGVSILERLREDDLLLNFNYKSSPYAYKYKNPKVGVLAIALRDIRDQILHFDILVMDSELLVKMKGVSERKDLMSFQNLFSDIKEQLNKLNYNFFLSCLSLAEEKWNNKTFIIRKGEYLNQLEKLMRELKNLPR